MTTNKQKHSYTKFNVSINNNTGDMDIDVEGMEYMLTELFCRLFEHDTQYVEVIKNAMFLFESDSKDRNEKFKPITSKP